MTNEIKENVEPTLEYLKICVEDDVRFETGNCKALLDYITNLQEESKRLNAALNKLEWFFYNREDYEWAELVRQVKVANIEWLENKGE